MSHTRRPTRTLYISDPDSMNTIIECLVHSGQTFTVEPGSTVPSWAIGLFHEGVEALERHLQLDLSQPSGRSVGAMRTERDGKAER